MNDWPALPLDEWTDTKETLNRWTQIVGKMCLARMPVVNHWWSVAFHLTSRGFATPAIPFEGRFVEFEFDFVAHVLRVRTSDGEQREIVLAPRSVADFYREFLAVTGELGLHSPIWPVPVEIEDPIPLDQDEAHRSYDREYASRFGRIVARSAEVFLQFRSEFLGKCSPVHFFWGSFDLAVTRFSGRRAPERPGLDAITREAYSHEVSSVGWWPGDSRLALPSFYSYAAPEPDGFRDSRVSPAEAYYNEKLGGFYLHYDDMRRSADPERMLLDFCRSTYDAAANAGNWDRVALERGKN